MPRGRRRKVQEEIMSSLTSAGPTEEVVAVETIDKIETIKEKPKTETYQRIHFRNLRDPGLNLSFTFNGLAYNLLDNEETTLKKEIVDHLSTRMVPDVKIKKNEMGDSVKIKTESPRFMCQVLDTFEKAV